ncbi:endo alpha-1,4 polygalactosaminidase [Candidatus Bipolaricaulota bacterium]
MIRRVAFGTRGILCSLVGLTWCLVGCTFLLADSEVPPSPRDAMRALVAELAEYTKIQAPDFLVIAQNGDELLTTGETAVASLASDYVAAVDGLGREDLFYGYSNDNQPTPAESTNWMLAYLDRAETLGIEVLVTDYCWDQVLMDDSYSGNAAHEFSSFAAPSRVLDIIPDYPAHPFEVHAGDVISLSDARNFLYLINPWQFETKASLLDALAGTNYDALILDLEFNGAPLSAEDVGMLKVKANGGTRLVLCYLSVGEAEDYRSYWNSAWSTNPPEWLSDENPDWPGNYPVRFWHPEWRDIVFAMLDDVLAAGFDGVYLDRVDVYEEFEN